MSAATRPSRELLLGWVLVLVGDGGSYGYDLQRELVARGLAIDPALLYRTLRQLERDSLLRSRWKAPSTGPRRRVYELTAKGRRALDELTLAIADARDSHDAFLRIRGRAA